jgi:hypothetical protein
LIARVIGAAALALVSASASAQSLDKTWLFQAAVYFPGVDSSIRADAANGDLGTVVDFERDLGFDRRSTLPAFMAEWRPGDDWVLNAEYYSVGRNSSTTLDRDITVGDKTLTKFDFSGMVVDASDRMLFTQVTDFDY